MNSIRVYTAIFCCIVIAYLVLLFAIPPDSSILTKYSLSPNEARVLSLTVALPLVAIWFAALVGLRRIARYAQKIKKDKEGKGFNLIAKGIAILVMGLPINTVLSSATNFISREHPNFTPTGTIITNYLFLGITFVGFFMIATGTAKLLERTAASEVSVPPVWRVIFTLFSIAFIYATFSNPLRSATGPGGQEAVYYLPDWLIVTSIAIPYIYAWYLGIKGAYQLNLYSRHVPGIIYRKALRYLSAGVAGVIGGSILIRFVSRLSTQLQESELRVLLGIIYLLLMAISVGYIYIAIGAKKLKQIEDV